jgi:hypothetical protein
MPFLLLFPEGWLHTGETPSLHFMGDAAPMNYFSLRKLEKHYLERCSPATNFRILKILSFTRL